MQSHYWQSLEKKNNIIKILKISYLFILLIFVNKGAIQKKNTCQQMNFSKTPRWTIRTMEEKKKTKKQNKPTQ